MPELSDLSPCMLWGLGKETQTLEQMLKILAIRAAVLIVVWVLESQHMLGVPGGAQL